MKTLFVGCHRDGTSGGRLSQQILLGLDAAGVDVAARPVCYQHTNLYPLPSRITELEKKSLSEYDNILQCVPHKMMDINKEYSIKNYVYRYPGAFKHQTKYTFLADRYFGNDGYPPQSFYESEVYDSPVPENLKFLQDSFVFYVIDKMDNNKWWSDLIYDFQSLFSKTNDVALVFKTWGNPNEINQFFEQTVAETQTKLSHKYYNAGSFKQPIVICDIVSDEDMVGLHKVGDVYLWSGDGLNSTWTDAKAFGIVVEPYDDEGGISLLDNCYGDGEKVKHKLDTQYIDHHYTKFGQKIVEKMQ